MSTLREVLAVLLGAESEAKRIIEETRNENKSYLRSVQEKFAARRASEMEAARERAKSVMENALTAAQTEAEQIIALGGDERERMQKHYDDNVGAVIDSMASEIAERLIAKGRARV